MKVVIQQRHTLDTYYLDCHDCGLARAITEQHPNFDFKSVGGNYVRDNRNIQHFFTEDWSEMAFKMVQSGVLSEFIIDIPVPGYDSLVIVPLIPEPLPKKEYIPIYVSEDFFELNKELIMQ